MQALLAALLCAAAQALRGPAAPVRAPQVLRATRSALGVAVSGSGSARPTARLSNDDLATFMDTTDEWISQRTGIRARRVLAPDESLAQLSAAAGTKALESAGVDPEDVGLVILATSSPDDLFGDATVVAKGCGCANAVAFDLTAACSGFLFSLVTAAQFVESGAYDKVLVVGSSQSTQRLNASDPTTSTLS